MAAFDRRPNVCGGELVVGGTRVPVRAILASLAEGATISEILADFPTLTEASVRAVIAFVAASAEEDLPILSLQDWHEVEASDWQSPALPLL